MNKYLLMCSAAVLVAKAGSGVALASTTVHFHSSSGASQCDYFVITNSGGGLFAAVHHGGVTCASTSVQNDAGVLDKKGKIPGKGGSVQFADTTLAKAIGQWVGLDFVLAFPFRTGAPFAVIGSENGTSAMVFENGIQYAGKVNPGTKKSVLHDAIAALGLKN